MRIAWLLVTLGVGITPLLPAACQTTALPERPPRDVAPETLPRGTDGPDISSGIPADNDVFSLAEEYLRRELEQRLGPARRYEVHLDRERSDLSKGRVGGADITALGVRTRNGLVISRIELHLGEVQLDENMHPLRTTVSGTFYARIGREAVSRFVRERAGRKVAGIKLDFHPGEIVVHAKPDLMGVGIRSEVTGRPVLNGRRAIDFEARRVSVFGMRLPAAARDALEKRINPVVDLSALKLPIRVTQVSVLTQGLEVRGTADLDESLLKRGRGREAPRKGRGGSERGGRRAPDGDRAPRLRLVEPPAVE